MNRLTRLAGAAFAVCLAAAAPSTASAQKDAEPACQRTCLEHWVDAYLAAMRDHKVDPKLFANEVRFTENGIQLPFGKEGLWSSTTAIGTYKFYVPDIETQQVAFIGTVRENGKGATDGDVTAIALRLRIENDRIAEAEQLAIRLSANNNNSSFNFPPVGPAVEAMKEPAPVFREVIPADRRPSREELVKTANYYFDGLQRNTGTGYYPFTDDCIRFENGFDVLANLVDPATGKRGRMSCKRQFEATLKGVVTGIRDRRFVAVDRERGIVFAFAFFDHRPINWTWQLGELFKIQDGKIRRIEAVFLRAPYGINSGWSTYEQGRSERIQSIH